MNRTSVSELLDEFERRAHSIYTSNQYDLGGVNHGKDAVTAIRFIRRALTTASIEGDNALQDKLIRLKEDYVSRNVDPQGIGAGLIEDLIRELPSGQSS